VDLNYFDKQKPSSLSEFHSQVQILATMVMREAGEEPEVIPEDEISRAYESGRSVLSAAANGVAEIRLRKFARGPYDYQERRVVEHLMELVPDIGAGMDPVGFLIASHGGLSYRSRMLRERAEAAGIDTSDIP
jgi:hypothetical protein